MVKLLQLSLESLNGSQQLGASGIAVVRALFETAHHQIIEWLGDRRVKLERARERHEVHDLGQGATRETAGQEAVCDDAAGIDIA